MARTTPSTKAKSSRSPAPRAAAKNKPRRRASGGDKAAARRRRGPWWLRLPGLLLYLCVAGFLVMAFDLETVDSLAMRPGLESGDLVLVDRVAVEMVRPGLGDVVMIRDPSDRRRELLVRIVADEDDHVLFDGGTLEVNGERLVSGRGAAPGEMAGALAALETAPSGREVESEVTLSDGTEHRALGRADALESTAHDLQLTVPMGHLFVLGDNRGAAFDSRSFGPIPIADVVGYVRIIVRTDDPDGGLVGPWVRWID